MKDNHVALFPVADALQVSLFPSGGTAKAHIQRTLNIGPWALKADIMVHCDYYDDDASASIVKIRKDLWALMLYSRPDAELIMALFVKPDGLKTNYIGDFCRQDDWLERIRANVKAVFVSKEKEGWHSAEIAVLDKRLEREGIQNGSAGSAD